MIEVSDFFHRIVALSGLAPLIAVPAIRRALARANIEPGTVGPGDLPRVLPSIETCLLVYLKPTEVAARLEALRKLGER